MSVCVSLLVRLWVTPGQKQPYSSWIYIIGHSPWHCRHLWWLSSISQTLTPVICSLHSCTTLCTQSPKGVRRIDPVDYITLALLASGFQFGWVNGRHQQKTQDARIKMTRDSFLLPWVLWLWQWQLLQQGCPFQSWSCHWVSALPVLTWLNIPIGCLHLIQSLAHSCEINSTQKFQQKLLSVSY